MDALRMVNREYLVSNPDSVLTYYVEQVKDRKSPVFSKLQFLHVEDVLVIFKAHLQP